MPIELIQALFSVGTWLFLVLVLVFLLIFLIQFLMPKQLLHAYFKPPYFKREEVIIFTGFPFGYIRTVMFMRLVSSPASGVRRGIIDAHTLVPVWFRWLSKLTLLAFVIIFAAFMSIMFIFIVEFFFLNPDRY